MKTRIKYIDYSRGIAILLVVIGHAYYEDNIVTNWIYSFHMPLFFIITGFLLYFNNSTDIKGNIFKRYKLLMIPYILFSTINIIGNYLINNLSLIVIKNDIFSFMTLFGIGALWFLPVIFIAESIFLFNKNAINKNKCKILVCIAVLSVVFMFIMISRGNYNSIVGKFTVVFIRTVVALFFINIGYYTHKFIKDTALKLYQLIILVAMSIVLSLFNGHVDLWGLQFNNLFLYVFNSIVGSFSIIFITKKINRSKILDFLGKNTLIIMATHQLIIKSILATSIGVKLNKLLLLGLVLIIEYPIIKIINNYFTFMLGKKKIRLEKMKKLVQVYNKKINLLEFINKALNIIRCLIIFKAYFFCINLL